MEAALQTRSGGVCELCTSSEALAPLAVAPKAGMAAEECALVCATCAEQIQGQADPDPHHWRCLNDSMWSELAPVQVLAWRMLKQLSTESWARDLFDMLYLEEDTKAWAEAGQMAQGEEDSEVRHIDSNGSVLEAGDSVVLIKDLVVKGGGFTAKRGTAVRGIALVPDNPEHIEGRINGQKIVILTKFVKKS
jgi:protein PhnA